VPLLNFSCSFHPIPPPANTLPWGFVPIVILLEIRALEIEVNPVSVMLLSTPWLTTLIKPLPQYYYSLPQNITRPGGEVVEMTITSRANGTLPFSFVSDAFTAGEVNGTIITNCIDAIVSDPIPFNSTGNIQPRSVVQYYRGGTAAILLQGYDNSKESPSSSNPVPNPPFPPSINITSWECLNSTIGESLPLMNGGSGFPHWAIALCAILPILLILCCFITLFCTGDESNGRRDFRSQNKSTRRLLPDTTTDPFIQNSGSV
jgi:hypothetical protein